MNDAFTYIIVISVMIFISPYFFKKWHSSSSLQNIVTSAGILGTFIGIVLGLKSLDFSNLENSIPQLLNGLFIAFFTSIAGLSASLMLKIYPKFYSINEDTEENKSMEDRLSDIVVEIKSVNNSLSGEGDTTLLTQIQKLRTSLIDKQDELNKSFKEFAEKMVEDNAQSLIDALTEVMKDFNTKINEQFGDNFKQLNEGVGKMLEWQENYKEQIVIATDALSKSKDSLEQTSTSMSTVVSQHEDLAKVTNELKTQLETMGIFISSIKSLSDTLETSGNTIRKEIEDITQKSLNELGTGLARISEKLVSDYSKLQNVISQISNRNP